jgi:DNA-binding transcriptional LysR family regulator
MELRHLRYFVAVAEELHFGRAARRLGIAQPPLSQQIRKLEEELGAPLFVRASRRVQLTEVGRTFLDEARATLAASDRAMRVVKRAIAGDLGRLHFGYVASAVMHAPFTTLMRRFRERHPDVDLVLEPMPTGQQVIALRERRIDAGFLRPPIEGDASDLVVLPMVHEGFVAVLPEGHRLANRKSLDVGDLRGDPFVLFERVRAPGLYDMIMRLLARAGVEPAVKHEVNPMQTVAGLVAAGFGISVMPASIQRIDVHGVVYRALPTKQVVDIAFAQRTDADSPALRAFASVAREIAKVKAKGA